MLVGVAGIGVRGQLDGDGRVDLQGLDQALQRVLKLGLEVPFAQIVKDVGQHDRFLRYGFDVVFFFEVLAELKSNSGFLCAECEVVVLVDGNVVGRVLVHLALAEIEVTFVVGAGHVVRAVAAHHAHLRVADILLRLGIFDSA